MTYAGVFRPIDCFEYHLGMYSAFCLLALRPRKAWHAGLMLVAEKTTADVS
jgi:hypothetical protein